MGDAIMKTHQSQNIVMIYRKGLALQSSLRMVQRGSEKLAVGQLQLSF